MLIWENENYRIYKADCIRCGCFVLRYKNCNVLIDTSMKFERNRLLNSLRKDRINHLNAIVVTHNHTDHAANAAYLQSLFHCPVYASALGMEGLKNGVCTMPKGTAAYSRMLYDLVENTGLRVLSKFEKAEDVRDITELLDSGILGDGVELMETPGHTADSISLIIDGQAALIGDAMVRYPWMQTVFLPWADEPQKIMHTWEALFSKRCEVYFQAHGPQTSRKMLKDSIIQNEKGKTVC